MTDAYAIVSPDGELIEMGMKKAFQEQESHDKHALMGQLSEGYHLVWLDLDSLREYQLFSKVNVFLESA